MVHPRRDTRSALQIARLYHGQGLTQAEIATRIGLSQSRVSRALRAAAAQGLVRTIVVPPAGVHTHLEDELCKAFGLRDVVLADATGRDHDVRAAVARSAAAYLGATISHGDRIGISPWSGTLLAVMEEFSRSSTSRPAGAIVQILGGVGAPAAQVLATRMVQELAQSTSARAVLIPAPGLLTSEIARAALESDGTIAAARREWGRLNTVVLGIGPLVPTQLIRKSGNAVPAPDLRHLADAGAVGDISLRYFDDSGSEVRSELSNRVLGIESDQLFQIDRRIGVAGGSEKRRAIVAALRGGWVNILITDVGVGRWLLANGLSGRAAPGPSSHP
jgi:DNA-binding transcriptional regulator LsrR (DeoR family)